jgi:hypothetical protein
VCDDPVPPGKSPADRTRKGTYAPPRLVSYGRFADIVQGQGGVKQEPGGPKAGPRSRV